MGSTLGPKAIRQIEEIARRVLGETRNEGGHRARYTGPSNVKNIFLAKTTTAHAVGATKRVQIYSGLPGATTAASTSVDAYNYFADMAASQWVVIGKINGGFLLIAGNPCST